MSKYEFPLYGIDIPPDLIPSQTKTYDIYTEQCNNLDSCIRNLHYTIPRKRCSPEKGIILPHYTRYNKEKGVVDRTYYFPEHIDNPMVCDNMMNYKSKISRVDKICDKANNICRIKLSRDDIPDVYTQIYEIVNELDKVFNLLKQFCESSNEIHNQHLERRIHNIILSFDLNRENLLYTTNDTYLNLDNQLDESIQTTRQYLTTIPTKLYADKAEYSNKDEFKEYIKHFLKEKYVFLSYFIQFIIRQPVDITDQIRNIDTIQRCEVHLDSQLDVKKGLFSDLSKLDDEQELLSSPDSVGEKGQTVSFTQLEMSLGKKKDDSLSDEQLLKQSIKSIQDSLKQRILDILDLNINENFVLAYLHNESVPIERLATIRNECDELLIAISDYKSKASKKDKLIISKSDIETISNTRNLLYILEIYYVYPDYSSIVQKMLDLNDYQLKFLEKYSYKFDKKFYLNFLRATQNYIDFLRLFIMIQHHHFINIVCFLITTAVMVPYINQIINNLINRQPCLKDISQNQQNIIEKVFPGYISINVKEKYFLQNSALIELLIQISNNICNIDLDLTTLEYDPYDVLGLKMKESYEITIKTLIDKMKLDRENKLLIKVKDLIGTKNKKEIFDKKLDQHLLVVIIFCNGLYRIILKIMQNLINSEEFYNELFPYIINNLILIMEKYTMNLCYPIFRDKMVFYLTIINNLKLINDDRLEQSNEQIFKNIKNYITEPHPFSEIILKDISTMVLFCNALISKEKLNQTSAADPEWTNLLVQFQQDIQDLRLS
jgi:hypothetical protein